VTSFATVTNNMALVNQWVPWLLQKSFPVVRVVRVDDMTVNLTQSPCAPTLDFTVWSLLNLQVEEFDQNLNVLASYGVNLFGESLTFTLRNQAVYFVRVNGNSTSFCIASYATQADWISLFQTISSNQYTQLSVLAQLFALSMTVHIDSFPLYAFLSTVPPSLTVYTTALQFYSNILNRPLKYSPCIFHFEPQLFIGIAHYILDIVGWSGSSSMSTPRSIASKLAVYLRDPEAIDTAFQIFRSGVIPNDVQQAAYLAAVILNMRNVTNPLSVIALAQISHNQTQCDNVGILLQRFSDMGVLTAGLSAAFQQGTCQPHGILWELVKTYNVSNTVFSGAFASYDSILAISELSYLSALQTQNEITLVEQNILFCYGNRLLRKLE